MIKLLIINNIIFLLLYIIYALPGLICRTNDDLDVEQYGVHIPEYAGIINKAFWLQIILFILFTDIYRYIYNCTRRPRGII